MGFPHVRKETILVGGIALALIIGATGYFLFVSERVNSFTDCEKAGYEVTEAFPRQCQTPSGRTFTEDIDFAVNPSVTDVPFGNAVNLQEGGFATYEDGMKISIERFTDSRCPADAQCVWEGELGTNIRLEGGEVEGVLRLVLGAKQNPVGKGYGYTVMLEHMTETVATLRVVRE